MAKESRKKEKAEAEAPKFVPVDVTQLKVGALVDRPLYARMDARDKYLLMARALHPLEESVYQRFSRLGHVYSIFPAVEERYPELTASVHKARELLADPSLAPFERQAEFRKITQWLAELVFKRDGDAYAAVFFISRLLGAPRPETIGYVSELSVDLHERSLKVASVFGFILLLLGSVDEKQAHEMVSAAFCEEIGVHRQDNPNLRQIALAGASYALQDSDRALSIQSLARGEVPGVKTLDERVTRFIRHRGTLAAAGEELSEAMEFACWACGQGGAGQGFPRESRLARKLGKVLASGLAEKEEKAA